MLISRRSFVALASASLFAKPAFAEPVFTHYTPGLVDALLAEGKTVFIDYAAHWCSTCARQERVIQSLKAQNPEYGANVVFVRVDWDEYRNDAVTTFNNIPRRSTLIVLKGEEELGRIVADTRESEIKALMDLALNAAKTS